MAALGNKNAVGNKGGKGRPSAYRKEYAELAHRMALLGLKNAEMAEVFAVSERTFTDWVQKTPELSSALKEGRDHADSHVARALYHRALGYTCPDTHISVIRGKVVKTELLKHYPPDTAAAIIWLKNRHPDLWRDRMEHTGPGGGPIVKKVEVEFVDP